MTSGDASHTYTHTQAPRQRCEWGLHAKFQALLEGGAVGLGEWGGPGGGGVVIEALPVGAEGGMQRDARAACELAAEAVEYASQEAHNERARHMQDGGGEGKG